MQKNMVTNGYGIIAPRIATSLESARKTWFSRIMAGCGGTSAYDSACGELYQDVFGEGIFAGKGIIDVQAFYKLLDHAFDEGKILSHDILESAFLRCAFLSDCEMDDSFPSNLTSWYKRLHRWMRGDVQNLPFLDATVRLNQTERENPLSFLSRFKLFDNVRRAITPVFAFVCLLTALFTPLATSVWLTSIALLCTMMDSLLCIVHAILPMAWRLFRRSFIPKPCPKPLNACCKGWLLPSHCRKRPTTVWMRLYVPFTA